jgi:ribonuclease Z
MWIGRVDRIFITHLHGDHCYDIVGLLALRGMRKIFSPVEVVGPVGIRELIETTARLSCLYLPFKVDIIELKENEIHDLGWRSQEQPPTPINENSSEEDGEAIQVPSATPSSSQEAEESKPAKPSEDWHIVAYPLDHRISCFGYVFTEKQQLGSFDASVAMAKGVSGKDIGKLATCDSVVLSNGTTVLRSECLKSPFPGRKIVVLGDTHTCSSDLHSASNDADVFVHETTFEASMEELALRSKHSTTNMAVDCAIASKAKHLIITHFSARYTDQGGPKSVVDLLQEAQLRSAGRIPVTAAKDFWSIEISPKKAPATPHTKASDK